MFPLGSKTRKVNKNHCKVITDVTFSVTFFFIAFALVSSPRK